MTVAKLCFAVWCFSSLSVEVNLIAVVKVFVQKSVAVELFAVSLLVVLSEVGLYIAALSAGG